MPCALPFPVSGGIMLVDILDGCFMNFAYGWAFAAGLEDTATVRLALAACARNLTGKRGNREPG